METLDTIPAIRQRMRAARLAGRRIGFVPTMGALHDGHMSLVAAARRQNDDVVVSIFVNPTQFAPGEDFDRYPRTLEKDSAACFAGGVDCVFSPALDEVYPSGAVTTVHVTGLTDGLCGPFRPGHFEGVATVVTKLFNMVTPDMAYFGEKDYQQLQIVRRLVRDLNMPVEIVGCPTIRESDGLALSSRNAYLPPQARLQAAGLYSALRGAADAAANGEVRAGRLVMLTRSRIESSGPFVVDYVSLVDAETLEPLSVLDRPARLCLAARLGNTRLIDNIALDSPITRP